MLEDFPLPTTPRRVKVYRLESGDWADQGTGFCTGEITPEDGPIITVRNELDSQHIILKTRIKSNGVQYQKQQDTLVVWTEPESEIVANKNVSRSSGESVDSVGLKDGSGDPSEDPLEDPGDVSMNGSVPEPADMALSFQEPEGCTQICDFLVHVQRNLCPDISVVAILFPSNGGGEGEITEILAGPVQLPPAEPQLTDLFGILDVISQAALSQYSREVLTRFIVEQEYLSKLISLFHIAETSHKLKELHELCRIVKFIILLNDRAILEQLVLDHCIIGLVGILEYDPEFPRFKACHREYLLDKSRIKQVIPIGDAEILEKLLATFRLQFLKDVVLARILDDTTANSLSSIIFMNQVDIINFVKSDESFFQQLFFMYSCKTRRTGEQNSPSNRSDLADLELKRNGVKLVHQLTNTVKSLQPGLCTLLFETFVRKGLFRLLEFALRDSLLAIRVTGTELIVSIIEHDLTLIHTCLLEKTDSAGDLEVSRGSPESSGAFSVSRNTSESSEDSLCFREGEIPLVDILIHLLLHDEDIGLKIQANTALKSLLDTSWSENSIQSSSSGSSGPSRLALDTAHSGNSGNNLKCGDSSRFLTAFYRNSAVGLFEPLINLLSAQPAKRVSSPGDVGPAERIVFINLCDLIAFCARTHGRIARDFLIENDVWLAVKLLIADRNPKNMQARLAALRCLKQTVLLNDDGYTEYFITHNVFRPVIELLVETSEKGNLANSSCLDFLESIRMGCTKSGFQKNMKALVGHIAELYADSLMEFDCGRALLEFAEAKSKQSDHSISPRVEKLKELRELNEPRERLNGLAGYPLGKKHQTPSDMLGISASDPNNRILYPRSSEMYTSMNSRLTGETRNTGDEQMGQLGPPIPLDGEAGNLITQGTTENMNMNMNTTTDDRRLKTVSGISYEEEEEDSDTFVDANDMSPGFEQRYLSEIQKQQRPSLSTRAELRKRESQADLKSQMRADGTVVISSGTTGTSMSTSKGKYSENSPLGNGTELPEPPDGDSAMAAAVTAAETVPTLLVESPTLKRRKSDVSVSSAVSSSSSLSLFSRSSGKKSILGKFSRAGKKLVGTLSSKKSKKERSASIEPQTSSETKA